MMIPSIYLVPYSRTPTEIIHVDIRLYQALYNLRAFAIDLEINSPLWDETTNVAKAVQELIEKSLVYTKVN